MPSFVDGCGCARLGSFGFASSCLLRCLYSDTEGIRDEGFGPSAVGTYIRCEDDAGFRLPLTALAGPPADTQSYSSVG